MVCHIVHRFSPEFYILKAASEKRGICPSILDKLASGNDSTLRANAAKNQGTPYLSLGYIAVYERDLEVLSSLVQNRKIQSAAQHAIAHIRI